jgi:AcrR family transcriptional regulator
MTLRLRYPAAERRMPTKILTTDRRILRLRRRLREALFACVLEAGWERASITAICARAEVPRTSFTSQFADKEALLLSGLDDLPALMRRTDDRPFAFARDLIAHMRDYYPLTRALRKRMSQTVIPRLRKLVLDLVTADVGVTYPKLRVEVRDATAHLISGGMVESIVGWLDAGAKLEPRALEATIRTMSVAALDSVRP